MARDVGIIATHPFGCAQGRLLKKPRVAHPADYDFSFLELIETKITNQVVTLEFNQTKRNYLHPVSGSDAAKVDAGLFMKPMA
jgi:hypothetical protein